MWAVFSPIHVCCRFLVGTRRGTRSRYLLYLLISMPALQISIRRQGQPVRDNLLATGRSFVFVVCPVETKTHLTARGSSAKRWGARRPWLDRVGRLRSISPFDAFLSFLPRPLLPWPQHCRRSTYYRSRYSFTTSINPMYQFGMVLMYRCTWYGCTNATVLSCTHGLHLARPSWLGLAAAKKESSQRRAVYPQACGRVPIYILPLPPSRPFQLL